MFEDQYRKYCREITPSSALDEETIALMQEAQNHRAAPAPKPLRWRPAVVLPVAGTAAAAAIALIITGAWLLRGDGQTFDDTLAGDIDGFFDSAASNEASSDSLNADQDQPEESDPASGEEEDPSDAASTDSGDEENEPNEDSASDQPEEDSLKTDVPDTETSDSLQDADSDQPKGSLSTSQPESDEAGTGNSSSNTDTSNSSDHADSSEDAEISATPSDPYGPEISYEKGIETYLSIREFIDALAKKETTGYGKNYYNARELLIVPSLLPNGARFRHLHLNTQNGKYSYSYYFAKDGRDYIIDIEVNAKTPKSLNELRLSKQHIATEEVLSAKKDDQLFFLFGDQDEVTVTLTDVKATEILTEEETAALLSQFKLERCSLTNTVVDMKY